MAKLIYDADASGSGIHLEADDGEEIPVDLALAWAALRQASALSQIADNIIGLDNAISSVANEIAGK